MVFKLFGMKCRVELVVLILLVGLFIGSTLMCNCMTYESFNSLKSSSVQEPPNNYLRGQWMSEQSVPSNSHKALLATLKNNNGSVVPLESNNKLIFSKNRFAPECCFAAGSNYSTSTGCNCITEQQVKNINQRGGNRSCDSQY